MSSNGLSGPAVAAAAALIGSLFAPAGGKAADLQAEPSLAETPAAEDPAAASGGLGLTTRDALRGTERRHSVGMAAEWDAGGGVVLRTEGALIQPSEAPAQPEERTLRGRLAYGGGFESLGIAPGTVTPWVEGERGWPAADAPDAGPTTRLSVGVDVNPSPIAGFSLSAGSERTGPEAPADVSANAGLKLKF